MDPGSNLIDDKTIAFEGGAGDAYTVALTRAPLAGETVTVSLDADAEVVLRVGGNVVTELQFTSADWQNARIVEIEAVDDSDVEGAHISVIRHSVASDMTAAQGSKFVDLDVRDLDVEIADSDTGHVIVRQTGGSTDVIEVGTNSGDLTTYVDPANVDPAAGPFVDTYTVVLSRQPTSDVEVVIQPGLTDTAGELTDGGTWGSLGGQITLQKVPTLIVAVRIDGRKLATSEFSLSGDVVTLTPTTTPAAISEVEVIYRYAEQGKQVLVSYVDGGGSVIESGTEIRLTFTSANWNVAQTVTVRALDDSLIDGGDVQVFAPGPRTLDGLRGPLRVEGGIDPDGDRAIPDPLLYVAETDPPEFVADANPNLESVETEQIDILNLFHNESVSADFGELTDTTITGLGMSPDRVIGGRLFAGGITYVNLEMLQIDLGSGSDRLLIHSTHGGATLVNAAKGDDQVHVRTVGGPTTINGQLGDDTISVGTLFDEALFDSAIDHVNAPIGGVIDQISSLLRIDGGADTDTVNLDDSGDTNDNVGVLDNFTVDDLDLLDARMQTVEILNASGGTFTLQVGAAGPTTAPLPFTVGAEELKTELVALSLSNVNDIVVNRAGDLFTIGFLGDEDLEAVDLGADGRSLRLVRRCKRQLACDQRGDLGAELHPDDRSQRGGRNVRGHAGRRPGQRDADGRRRCDHAARRVDRGDPRNRTRRGRRGLPGRCRGRAGRQDRRNLHRRLSGPAAWTHGAGFRAQRGTQLDGHAARRQCGGCRDQRRGRHLHADAGWRRPYLRVAVERDGERGRGRAERVARYQRRRRLSGRLGLHDLQPAGRPGRRDGGRRPQPRQPAGPRRAARGNQLLQRRRAERRSGAITTRSSTSAARRRSPTFSRTTGTTGCTSRRWRARPWRVRRPPTSSRATWTTCRAS